MYRMKMGKYKINKNKYTIFLWLFFILLVILCWTFSINISKKTSNLKISRHFQQAIFFCELTMIWSHIWSMMTKMFIQNSTPLCWSWRSFAPFLDAPWDNYFSFFYIKKGDIIILVGHLQTYYMENSGQEKKKINKQFFLLEFHVHFNPNFSL